MPFPSWSRCVVLGVVLTTILEVGHSLPENSSQLVTDDNNVEDKPKLIYLLLDGFRWDYLEMQEPDALPGFNKFLKEGVRAQWTNPVFPSLSYASWTTLVTGLYAESHNILGNYFYDPVDKVEFALSKSETTKNPKWWTSEPIWTTAEKAGLKTAQIQWSRCDVVIDGVSTEFCEPYLDESYHEEDSKQNIEKALNKIDEGYDLVQVYTVEPDVMGHKHGPDSEDVKSAVREQDSLIAFLMDELERRNMTDKVNIVIVSDHGMQDTAAEAVERLEVDQFLDNSLVEKIMDRNGLMQITAPQENIQKVFDDLSEMPGASVYKKEDIPENLHFKNSKYAPDILLVAQDGHILMPSSSEKQTPPAKGEVNKGMHGFSIDLPAMRGIFFAKGPAFQEGLVIDPIDLVDVYQVLTKVLQIAPQPHNGTWSHVEPAFDSNQLNGSPVFLVPFYLLSILFILSKCL